MIALLVTSGNTLTPYRNSVNVSAMYTQNYGECNSFLASEAIFESLYVMLAYVDVMAEYYL